MNRVFCAVARESEANPKRPGHRPKTTAGTAVPRINSPALIELHPHFQPKNATIQVIKYSSIQVMRVLGSVGKLDGPRISHGRPRGLGKQRF
jgi:hypothetical protein